MVFLNEKDHFKKCISYNFAFFEKKIGITLLLPTYVVWCPIFVWYAWNHRLVFVFVKINEKLWLWSWKSLWAGRILEKGTKQESSCCVKWKLLQSPPPFDNTHLDLTDLSWTFPSWLWLAMHLKRLSGSCFMDIFVVFIHSFFLII